MGGDHKCPVCQATFTRPQHVARHMRSHTGDRPYKCLYCGDQFARSDLLSRHCNKCHANERPLPNSGSRRRGSASAARATTSKQACDQCVQSSLPCDGSNPCAKCVQRKCRCTYVKFHRQTAPVGPGHSNPRPGTSGNPSSSLPNITSSSRMPMYSHIDEFLVGQQQPAPPMPDNLFSQPLVFQPIYSHAADPSQPVQLLTDNTDLGSAKFRQHPDPFRRASLPVPIQASATAPGAGLIPGLYTDPRQTSNWMAWGQENDPSFISTNHHPEAIHDKNSQAELSHPYMGTQGLLVPPTGEGPHSHHSDHRDRRGSSDYTSEGSSTSQSVPSSATSSSVHLPMVGMNLHHQFPPDHLQTYPLIAAAHHDRAYTMRGQEGGFSSAFGLMSLDDPNVLAGLANDGAPFFSDNVMSTLGPDDPNQTPMPAKQLDAIPKRSNVVPTPSKEAEIRELREFWKQYIRTPLSGPGPMGSVAAEAPGSQPQRHPSTSRRPRVTSLPNTKSPLLVEHPQRKDENPTSSIRTTLHAQEDLRSYEAAVLARKAPTLSLGPRARRNNTISTPSANLTPSPQVPALQIDSNLNYSYSPRSSRPSSATGAPAMAHWSGKHPPARLGYTHDALSTSSPPSRESSLSIEDGAGSGGSDRERMRPSCKRLSSQTLGPPNVKRTQVSHDELGGRSSSSGVPVSNYHNGGGGGGVVGDSGNANVNSLPRISVIDGEYAELGRPSEMRLPHAQMHHVERPTTDMVVDQRRKMSAPTMAPSIPAFTFAAPPGPSPGTNH